MAALDFEWTPFHPTPIPSGAPYPGAASHDQVSHECTACPHCAEYHIAWMKHGEDEGALAKGWPSFRDAISRAWDYLRWAPGVIQLAQRRAIVAAGRRNAARTHYNDFLANFGALLSPGVDTHNVSFTPREGWIELDPGPGVKVWVSGEEYVDEVAAALQSFGLIDQLARLNAELNQAVVDANDAEASYQAVSGFYEPEIAEARAWVTDAQARYEAARAEAKASRAKAWTAWQRCIAECNKVKEKYGASALLVAVALWIAGTGAVIAGKPFDSGNAGAVAQPAVEVAPPTPTPTPTPEPNPDPVTTEVDPPPLTTDDVKIDLLMQGFLGITAFDDFTPFLVDPTVPDKFELPAIDPPPLRTSFFAETLDQVGLADNLGPVPTMTHAGSAYVSFDEPIVDPEAVIFDRYIDLAGVGFPVLAPPSTPAEGMWVLGARFDVDLFDPAVCAGNEFWLTLDMNVPSRGLPYVAPPPFPGDFYNGGNFFPNLKIIDCELSSYVDFMDAGVLTFDFSNPGAALIRSEPDSTRFVMVFPDTQVPPDSEFWLVGFEHPSGQPFSPDNTRYQPWPDNFGPPAGVTEGTTTDDCDFTLQPVTLPAPPAPADDPGGGAPLPSPDGSTGGGTDPDPGNPDGGGGTTPIGEPGRTDPDETNAGLVASGVVLAGIGAGVASTRHPAWRRKEKETGEPTGAESVPGAPPPGGPTTTRPDSGADASGEPTASAPNRQAFADALANEGAASEAATADVLAQASAAMIDAERAYRSAASRYATRQAAEAAEGMGEALTDWWSGRGKTEVTLLERAATETADALAAFRKSVVQHIAVNLLTAPTEERLGRLQELESRFRADHASATAELPADVEGVITHSQSDPERVATLSAYRTALTINEVFAESTLIARSRLGPPDQPGMAPTRVVLDQLAGIVAETAKLTGTETDAHLQMRRWSLDTRRDLRVDTFVAVAEQATVYDPHTNAPVANKLRGEMAKDRITWLAEYLDDTAWRRNDARLTRSSELRQRLKELYGSFDYLGYGHVSMKEFFIATTRAIRSRQDDVNTWFLSDYLGLKDFLGSKEGQDTGSTWRMAWASANIGLGTKGRAMGYGGTDSVDSVKARIASMNDDADLAVLALQTAAETDDPNRWPTGTRRLSDGSEVETEALRKLLISFGYITSTPDGLRYQMPTADRAVAGTTGIKRPGSHWLDVVSARNAGEVMLSVALPELASARIAAFVSRTGVTGARWATAVRVLADQGIGVGIDVGLSYVKTEESQRDLSEIVAQSLVNNVVGVLSGKGTDRLAELGVDRLAVNPRLSGYLSDPQNKAFATTFVGEVLGVPGDTVSQLIVDATRGKSISSDDVLGGLLGSAMNRYLGRVSKGTLEHPRFAALTNPEIHTVAMVVDKQLNDTATAVFDTTVAGRPMTAETGTSVFEALRRGDLSWEQLQRVYSLRGDTMRTVMTRVNDLRNELVGSIGTRARVLAREAIDLYYDPRIAGTTDPTERSELQAEKAAELSLVADPLTETGVALQFTSEALDIAVLSRQELIDWLTGTEIAEKLDLGSINDIALHDLAIQELESRYTKAVRDAAKDEIAPGSAGLTSDVDRSWSSEFLRRAAREIVLAEMTKGRMDGGTGPTTARAFDVNEYVNVMRRIPMMMASRSSYAERTVARVELPGTTFALTHADAVEANSFASAMLHMSSEERGQFATNQRDGKRGEALTRVDAMLSWAESELAQSESELARYIESELREQGKTVVDDDVALRARDELYGDRMRALDELGHSIDRAADGPEQHELMSRWELAMNRALRDGIETYSDMANLDIIVMRMQSQKKSATEKYTAEDLMRAEWFKLGAQSPDGTTPPALAGITSQQIRSMLNDQILMFMHHVHGLHSGYESPGKATRSLAKYAERALLALNLLGEFHPDHDGPYSALFEATSKLLVHKDDPKKLLETLADLRGDNRGTRENLRWYLDQLELLPGMKGLTAGPPLATGPGRGSAVVELAARQRLRAKWAMDEVGQGDAWAALVLADLDATLTELVDVAREIRLETELRGYLPSDREAARGLLDEVFEIQARVDFVTSRRFRGAHSRALFADLTDRRLQLDAMGERWRRAGRPGDAETEAHIAALERRQTALEATRDRLLSELDAPAPTVPMD